MEAVSCPLCGESRTDVAIEESGFRGVRCDSCRVIYISPRPSLEEIERFYSDDWRPRKTGRSLYAVLQARLRLALLHPYQSSGDLLDFGAGGADFLGEAKKKGFSVYAVELNPVKREQICARGFACSAELSGQYDVIHMSDVLSHLHDPCEQLKEVGTHLRKNGILVLETGNLGDVCSRYYDRFTWFGYPGHLYFFGEEGLRQLLSRAGFRVLAARGYNILPSLWLDRRRKRSRPQANWATGRAPDAAHPVALRLLSVSRLGLRAWRHERRRADPYVAFILRYGLGRYLPKKGRPQTLILVAQKTP